MTNSKNSSSPRDTSRRGSKSEKSAPGSNDQDRPLKLATARALASAGLYVRTNVVLSEHRAGSGPGEKWAANVTDVDVLAISHGIDLAADIACVTCKGGTNVSVLHETFALAGLMRYLHARRGYGVFAKKATEPHMIALGQQLDIALMSDAEWQHWRGRIAGSYPIPRTFEETIEAEVAVQLRKRSDLAPLVSYLRTEFWFYRDYRNVQHLVGQVRRAGERLNNSPLMQFVFLDACSLFALSIFQLCEYVSSG